MWWMNDKWIMWIKNMWKSGLWKRYDRLLRPINNSGVMDVIELEPREYDEWTDKWMTNIEYILND